MRPRVIQAALACLAALVVASISTPAAAADVERHGGQWEVLIGGSGCMPGKVACRHDGAGFPFGTTYPSFGTGVTLGWRATSWFMIGGAYRLGLFDPAYTVQNGADYRVGYQNSVYLLFKPIIPVWRFDIGLGLGPGFSRQVFKLRNGDRDYSQGFSFMIGPSLDFWVAPRLFLGGKVDFLLNAHRTACSTRGGDTSCSHDPIGVLAPVHQVLFGFHLGGTFG